MQRLRISLQTTRTPTSGVFAMSQEPTIGGYRAVLESGHAAARGMLRRTPDDADMRSGLEQYRRIFAMLDSMTEEEEAAPFDVIDSERIRRIASSAGTTDQEVIQLLFSYREYYEKRLRVIRDLDESV